MWVREACCGKLHPAGCWQCPLDQLSLKAMHSMMIERVLRHDPQFFGTLAAVGDRDLTAAA